MRQDEPEGASGRPVYGGRYRLGEELGRGGMGRVFVARDLVLERSVAIKVLAPGVRDEEDDKRLEQEARTAGSLNHPNVVVVHDIGRGEGGPYVVTELLEGETLRQRLGEQPLPLRKALDFGAQLSRGLAAAHEKGLVHRDIKPENLFLTPDGRLKILDFGIARLVAAPLATTSAQDEAARAAGRPAPTEPGALLGTVAYMSPEQVRGRRADHRSDLFSAGVVLYEMLTGQPPFGGSTSIEIAWAIVNAEPPPLPASVPASVARVVNRCLEKEPAERFQSARDLAFDLEALVAETRAPAAPRRRKLWPLAVLVGLSCLLAFGVGRLLVRHFSSRGPPGAFRQLTFARGFVGAARFAPDGQTVLYSQASGEPPRLFSLRLDRPDAQPVHLPMANLLGVSQAGEMAVLLHPQMSRFDFQRGMLGRVPLGGGTVREVAEGVEYADWGPRDELALVRPAGVRTRLEFPPGHVLYETTGWISHPRFSPKGDAIAFLHHPDPAGDDAGSVELVDLEGRVRTLAADWKSVQGLAWAPGGREVWFTASSSDASFSQTVLRAVDLSGKQRVVAEGTGRLKLEDISAEGRVILTKPDPHLALVVVPDGAASETDLSMLEIPVLFDFARDGSAVLLNESGAGAKRVSSIFVRKIDGSPPLGLGLGQGLAFSPDARLVVAVPTQNGPRGKLALVPTGAGETKTLEIGSVAAVNARWLPGGDGLVLAGTVPGGAMRLYVKMLAGGEPRAISEEGVAAIPFAVSLDGTRVAAAAPGGDIKLYPVAGGEPEQVRAAKPDEVPLGFGPGGSLFVHKRAQLPARIFRIDLARGTRSPWKTLLPHGAMATQLGRVAMTPDAKSFAYNFADMSAQLFLLEGLE